MRLGIQDIAVDNIGRAMVTLGECRLLLNGRPLALSHAVSTRGWKKAVAALLPADDDCEREGVMLSISGCTRTPDAYCIFEEEDGTNKCLVWIEVEDTHPMPRSKLLDLAQLWSDLDASDYWDMLLVVSDRYGTTLNPIPLCDIWHDAMRREKGDSCETDARV